MPSEKVIGNPLSWRRRAWEKRESIAPPAKGYRKSVSAILRSPPPLPAPTDKQRVILLKVLLGIPTKGSGIYFAKAWGVSSIEEAAVLALQVGYIELPFEIDS